MTSHATPRVRRHSRAGAGCRFYSALSTQHSALSRYFFFDDDLDELRFALLFFAPPLLLLEVLLFLLLDFVLLLFVELLRFFAALDCVAARFFAVARDAACFVLEFFAEARVTAGRFGAAFFVVDFDDLEEVFDDDFEALAFPDEADFAFGAGGTFPPARRASDNPMAMACLRLATFLPEPDFNVPRFNLCSSVSTFSCALFPYRLAIQPSCT